MDGEESSGTGIDSGWIDSNSLASCKLVLPGLEGAAGELDDKVPAANFHAPSKMVFHENGTVDTESRGEGVESSGSGSTEGIVDGSVAKIDSLGSVRSGTGAELGN